VGFELVFATFFVEKLLVKKQIAIFAARNGYE
jgi:hypothetical protein